MPRTNDFVIPTPDGQLLLHVAPGPCQHQEHWLDPLHFGFRDSLRSHVGLHALVGLLCILLQLCSRHSEFVWYGRLGVGTWAGLLFLATCLVGSYAAGAVLSPRGMRSWLVAYVAVCGVALCAGSALSFLNAVYSSLHLMTEWQHALLALLGALEAFFCLIHISLVLYRLCSTPAAPNGFDLHLLLEYASPHGERVTATEEGPPPSYDQLYRPPPSPRETAMEMVDVTPPDEGATPSQSREISSNAGSHTRLHGEALPLATLRRWDILQGLFGRAQTAS
ncbi:uncharacterized protein LOC129593304 [Paramacrobiotus metropolitanus]|uniref:uncharacterized protein LOC129593304 n=1 Tax=Paramacrobiotus metropolitanus TaxID=2943436 RepID=UPI002445C0E8|nr:uncharacterized protein LOC129593304 [Paramacrobiotus metropolitanus]